MNGAYQNSDLPPKAWTSVTTCSACSLAFAATGTRHAGICAALAIVVASFLEFSIRRDGSVP